MSDGYSAIYKYYDSFTGNVDYYRRADFIESNFKKYKVPEIILDLGCGTGTLMKILTDKGYDLIGVDISPDMLQVAMEKNPGQLLLCQDITTLDLYGTVQAVICMQDTLNHLRNLEEVERTLERVALFLEKGCLFIFDVNSEYKHKTVLADNVFVYETKNAFLVWQNSTDKDLNVKMKLDLFESDNGNSYRRESGYIEELFLSRGNLEQLLINSRFEILETYDGDSLSDISESTQRVLYITRKV